MFGDLEWNGYYLGLFPLRDEQPANTRKLAVAFNADRGDEFAYADPPAAIDRP